LLLSVAIQYFNEGLMPMRLLSMKDIFLNKKYFAVEPAEAQAYQVVIMLPWTFKVLMGLTIDARLVSKRKYYLALFGFTCMVT
jgi:hypothetical protein